MVGDHLAFDIAFGLPRAPVKRPRRLLIEADRRAIAESIVEHLQLCGWEFRLAQRVIGHGTGGGGGPS
jgi:hypothetical protein